MRVNDEDVHSELFIISYFYYIENVPEKIEIDFPSENVELNYEKNILLSMKTLRTNEKDVKRAYIRIERRKWLKIPSSCEVFLAWN